MNLSDIEIVKDVEFVLNAICKTIEIHNTVNLQVEYQHETETQNAANFIQRSMETNEDNPDEGSIPVNQNNHQDLLSTIVHQVFDAHEREQFAVEPNNIETPSSDVKINPNEESNVNIMSYDSSTESETETKTEKNNSDLPLDLRCKCGSDGIHSVKVDYDMAQPLDLSTKTIQVHQKSVCENLEVNDTRDISVTEPDENNRYFGSNEIWKALGQKEVHLYLKKKQVHSIQDIATHTNNTDINKPEASRTERENYKRKFKKNRR